MRKYLYITIGVVVLVSIPLFILSYLERYQEDDLGSYSCSGGQLRLLHYYQNSNPLEQEASEGLYFTYVEGSTTIQSWEMNSQDEWAGFMPSPERPSDIADFTPFPGFTKDYKEARAWNIIIDAYHSTPGYSETIFKDFASCLGAHQTEIDAALQKLTPRVTGYGTHSLPLKINSVANVDRRTLLQITGVSE